MYVGWPIFTFDRPASFSTRKKPVIGNADKRTPKPRIGILKPDDISIESFRLDLAMFRGRDVDIDLNAVVQERYATRFSRGAVMSMKLLRACNHNTIREQLQAG